MPSLDAPESSLTALRRLALLAAAATALTVGVGAAAAGPLRGSGQPDFGPNVIVFDPSMPTSQIQARVDAIAAQQVDNEMGTQRYGKRNPALARGL